MTSKMTLGINEDVKAPARQYGESSAARRISKSIHVDDPG